jgi:hypothetical protein
MVGLIPTVPSGTAPSGTAPSGTAPSGTAPSGTEDATGSGTPVGGSAPGATEVGIGDRVINVVAVGPGAASPASVICDDRPAAIRASARSTRLVNARPVAPAATEQTAAVAMMLVNCLTKMGVWMRFTTIPSRSPTRGTDSEIFPEANAGVVDRCTQPDMSRTARPWRKRPRRPASSRRLQRRSSRHRHGGHPGNHNVDFRAGTG